MKYQDRPFARESDAELLGHVAPLQVDLHVLEAVAYELQFRPLIDTEEKADIVDWLIRTFQEVGETDAGEGHADVEVDDVAAPLDLKEKRRQKLNALGEEEFELDRRSLLWYSGYSVGHNGVPGHRRQVILDTFHRHDDLSDISEEHANLWGRPKSPRRLQKMAEDIARKLNCDRDPHADFTAALRQWAEDLRYLERYYLPEMHRSFDWPAAEA